MISDSPKKKVKFGSKNTEVIMLPDHENEDEDYGQKPFLFDLFCFCLSNKKKTKLN